MDRHVIEPQWIWQEYLPQAERHLVPKLVSAEPTSESMQERLTRLGEFALIESSDTWHVEGRPVMRCPEKARLLLDALASTQEAVLAAAGTPEGQLKEMDVRGVERALLVPTMGNYLAYNDAFETRWCHLFASAYNRWLEDFSAKDPTRLLPAALITRYEPERMLAELDSVIQRGFRAIVLRPDPVAGRPLSAPELRPLWERCQSEQIVVLLHGGAYAFLDTVARERFTTGYALNVTGHAGEAPLALLSLLEGGVLESFPHLNFVFLESGVGWLPYWLDLMDSRFDVFRAEMSDRLTTRPSELFHRQCMVALDPEEASLASTLKAIGAERVVTGTDFPHLDHSVEAITVEQRLSETLGQDDQRRVLWSNAESLFRTR